MISALDQFLRQKCRFYTKFQMQIGRLSVQHNSPFSDVRIFVETRALGTCHLWGICGDWLLNNELPNI